MSPYELVSSIVAGLSLVLNAVVLIFIVKQVKLLSTQVADAGQAIEFSTRQAEVENLRRGKQVTMEFISRTISKLQELSARIPSAGSSQQTAFLDRASLRDSTEFLALRDYLNYLEDICVGVNMRIFDDEVVLRTMGGRLRRAWQYYEPWITKEREVVGNGLFIDLEIWVRGEGHIDSTSGHSEGTTGA